MTAKDIPLLNLDDMPSLEVESEEPPFHYPLECVACGILERTESSVRTRSDGRVRCNDCAANSCHQCNQIVGRGEAHQLDCSAGRSHATVAVDWEIPIDCNPTAPLAPPLPAIGTRVDVPVVVRFRRIGKVVGHEGALLLVELPGGEVGRFELGEVEVEP